MCKLRLLPIVLNGILLFIGLVSAIATHGAPGSMAFLTAGAVLFTIACSVFAWQTHLRKRGLVRGRGVLDEVARTAFDRPATVVPKFESSLVGVARAFAPGSAIAPVPGFTASGTVRGVATKIATCTSLLGQQRFEMVHTYSYVCVDAENAAGHFGFVGRDQVARWAMWMDALKDHKLGDEAFDQQWVVGGDRDLAMAVFDAPLRAQLVALQQRAHAVSTVGMSIQLTGEGLVVRWPGELDAALAMTLRDLALTVRDRLLQTLRAQGLIDAGMSVRVDARGAQAEEGVVSAERTLGARADG